MPVLHVRTGAVYASEAGSGPALVLLHANGHSRHDFASIMPALAERFRVIALDWPGFGDSPLAEPGSATALLLADVLEDVVDALELDAARFIGHSVGAFAAARLAARQPQRVTALVQVAPGGWARHTPFTRLFCRIKGSPRVTHWIDSRFARWYLRQRTPWVNAILAQVDRRTPAQEAASAGVWRSFAAPDHDLRPLAAQIQAPVLSILGRADPVITPRSTVPGLRAGLPHGRIEIMDTGHAPFAEAPGAFLELVVPFLNSVNGG